MTDDPIVCLACQQPITPEKDHMHICIGCLLDRHGTTHPNWTNAAYWRQFAEHPITNAAEARYELKQQRRNRFTREEISA